MSTPTEQQLARALANVLQILKDDDFRLVNTYDETLQVIAAATVLEDYHQSEKLTEA